MNKIIKLILSILLLLCLFDMPYGYYQFVRLVAGISFAYFAYAAYEEKKEIQVLLYIGLAILFQPFLKIALGRELWNIVDVLVAIGLVISIIKIKLKK
ncbi:MAG: hypothetical protein KA523_08190 [Flavobacterium sp.]|nr:hypothetical protein [Flavobacterium sp.]